ncbi:MAG: SLBB domain-containing protein [Bryobacteraceae bacterium]|nr:SLBB domain-containing protein [Bryobacteraceae bacterium]
MTRPRRFLAASLLLLLPALPALPQMATRAATGGRHPASAPQDAGLANLPSQPIGAFDLLAISVYDAPELTRTVRVGEDGLIALPMVGQKLKAAGLMPAELEKSIGSRLQEAGILMEPVVVVTVAEYASRPVSVVGAVRKPLTFQASGRVTLLDALARAEGLTSDAGTEILLSRAKPGGEDRELIRIPVIELMQMAKPELNYLLRGGEEIRVPEAQKVYVVGNVKKPGAYIVRDGTPMTVLKVLALAEGLERYSQKEAYIYRAEGSSGVRREILVQLSQVMARKRPDETLLPEDLLYIPEAKGKKATLGALEKAASFGMATVSGVLIWH